MNDPRGDRFDRGPTKDPTRANTVVGNSFYDENGDPHRINKMTIFKNSSTAGTAPQVLLGNKKDGTVMFINGKYYAKIDGSVYEIEK